MSDMAMDNEISETIRSENRDQETIPQGLVTNKAELRTPGDMLREAREAHDYSVADLCAQTLLSRQTIEALEDNRFEQLSQPVFARGYYRKCAKVLDMDADALMAAYAASGGARLTTREAPILGVNVVPADVTPDRRRTFGAFFLMLILVIAAFAVYLFWAERDGSSMTAADAVNGITLSTQFSGMDSDADDSGDTAILSPLSGLAANSTHADATFTPVNPANGMTDNSAASTANPAAGASASEAAATESANTGAASNAVDSGNSSSQSSTSQDSTSQAAAGGSVVATALTLQFKQRSWVNVHDATGKQLLVGIYETTSRTLDGVPPYKLVIGYAPGVDVRLGDKAVNFQVADNNTARFSVGSTSQ